MSTPRFGFLDMLQVQANAYQAGVEDGKASAASDVTKLALERDSLLAAAQEVLREVEELADATNPGSPADNVLAQLRPWLVKLRDAVREASSDQPTNTPQS